MIEVIGILFFVIACISAYYGSVYLISRLDNGPTASELEALELTRIELSLRALEHKAHFKPMDYTSAEHEAYAMLIRQRNALAHLSSATTAIASRAHSNSARIVGGPVRIVG